MSLLKKVASYAYIEPKTGFQSRIGCYVSTVSGEYMLQVVASKGFHFYSDEWYSFKTREEANAKFVEFAKRHPYKREECQSYDYND